MVKFVALFLVLLTSCISKKEKENGLVANFSFNSGTAKDETGNNNAKILGATLASDRFGNSQAAYYLQGNYNSYINLGTSSILKPIVGSISLWVNIDRSVQKGQGVPYNPIIITKSHGGDDFFEGYFIGMEKDSYKLNSASAKGEAQGVTIACTESLTLNQWHHIVLSYNNEYLWLYVDGVLQNDNKPMIKNFTSSFLETDSVMVGNMANTKNMRCLSGTVDDIQIYNKVLSKDEVYGLYHAPDPNKNHIYWLWFYRCLAVGIVLVLVILLNNARHKIAFEKEKEKNRASMRLLELETKAVRTQMNPHFMFNSLNTLQRFILEENNKGAHEYLAKFSKLLRKILESSTGESISLTEEIEILNSYLEIEKLRFNDSFEYKITNSVPQPENYHIPFLLVQPFVENAVWHGLLPMKGSRFLSVNFSVSGEKTLLCEIDDNGVGREYSAAQKDPIKKKSLALDFIRQRLELLERSTGTACSFKITDKKDKEDRSSGTRVEINIPKLN